MNQFINPISKKIRYSVLTFLILLLFLVNSSFGATKTFTGVGNFGTAARWNGSTLPVAGDSQQPAGKLRL